MPPAHRAVQAVVMEGVLGTLVSVGLVWPVAMFAIGGDAGSWESVHDTMVRRMLCSARK